MPKIIEPNDSEKGGQKQDGKENEPTTIKVGERTLTTEEVKDLIDQQSNFTQGSQEVAALKAVAEKYGVDVERYVEQAEGSFAVMTQLINEGIIDNQGNVLTEKKSDKKTDPLNDDDRSVGKEHKASSKDEKGEKEQMDSAVLKALESIDKRLKVVDQTQTNMIRDNLQGKIKAKHQNLSDADINEVFARAMNNPEKGLWQHAEDKAKENEWNTAVTRETYANEFGVNLKEFDENKLRQSDPDGGAAAMFAGKKFIFGGRNKRGEEGIDPGEAAKAWAEQQAKK